MITFQETDLWIVSIVYSLGLTVFYLFFGWAMVVPVFDYFQIYDWWYVLVWEIWYVAFIMSVFVNLFRQMEKKLYSSDLIPVSDRLKEQYRDTFRHVAEEQINRHKTNTFQPVVKKVYYDGFEWCALVELSEGKEEVYTESQLMAQLKG